VLRDVLFLGVSGIALSLIGAAVGALLALLSAIGLESRRTRQRLLSAIEIVILELHENQNRLTKGDRLTLGDWEQNKETLSQLAVKRPNLWLSLARTYGAIYESQRESKPTPMARSELTDLANELAKMLAGAYGRPPESQGGSKPAPPTGSELTDLANELANYADESLVTRIRYATVDRRTDRGQIRRKRRSLLADPHGGTARPG
jgi:hypothetical protein